MAILQFRYRASASFNRAATRAGTSSSMFAAERGQLLDAARAQETVLRGWPSGRADSMSGACMRLSWFISNSYSKSEIARRPLTIALRADSRAKSTTSESNGSARTLSRCARRLLDEGEALLDVEQRLALAHGRLTTATTTSSKMLGGARDHVEVAVGDRVVGAGADGDAVVGVMRRGCGSGCRRSGVRATSGSGEVERRAAVALGDDAAAPAPARGAATRESSRPSPGALPVRRVEEDQIVCVAALACVAQRARAGIRSTRASAAPTPSASRFARTTRRGAGVALDEDGARGAARERLDAERARARRRGRGRARRPAARASRTAPRGRGRPSAASPAPGGRLQPAPAEAAGDDAHGASRRDRQPAPRRRGRALQRVGEQHVLGRGELGVGVQQRRARRCGRGPAASPSSGRRAKRKAARPDWRVPISSPSPRSSRSISASAEAVAVLGQRAQPGGLLGAEEQADATRARRGRCARAAGAAARCRSARRPRRASPSRWGRRCRPR